MPRRARACVAAHVLAWALVVSRARTGDGGGGGGTYECEGGRRRGGQRGPVVREGQRHAHRGGRGRGRGRGCGAVEQAEHPARRVRSSVQQDRSVRLGRQLHRIAVAVAVAVGGGGGGGGGDRIRRRPSLPSRLVWSVRTRLVHSDPHISEPTRASEHCIALQTASYSTILYSTVLYGESRVTCYVTGAVVSPLRMSRRILLSSPDT